MVSVRFVVTVRVCYRGWNVVVMSRVLSSLNTIVWRCSRTLRLGLLMATVHSCLSRVILSILGSGSRRTRFVISSSVVMRRPTILSCVLCGW